METPLNQAAPPIPQPGGAVHNHTIANHIAHALNTGIYHPGNRTQGEAPAMIELPMFRNIGMPPPLAKAVKDSALMVAQAITYTIETVHKHTIIPTPELEALRAELEALRAQQEPPCPTPPSPSTATPSSTTTSPDGNNNHPNNSSSSSAKPEPKHAHGSKPP